MHKNCKFASLQSCKFWHRSTGRSCAAVVGRLVHRDLLYRDVVVLCRLMERDLLYRDVAVLVHVADHVGLVGSGLVQRQERAAKKICGRGGGRRGRAMAEEGGGRGGRWQRRAVTEEGGGGGERRARCPVAGRRRGRQGCRDAPHVGLQLDAELAQWQLPAFRLPGERTSQQQLQPLEGGGERPARCGGGGRCG